MRTHTFVLDSDTTDIVKTIPKQKKSQYIREAIMAKALSGQVKQQPEPEIMQEKPIVAGKWRK